MGIRIHKTLGYGLANLKCKGYKIVDKRINPKGILLLDCEEREEVYSRENYAKWLRERYEACGDDYSGDKMDLAWDLADAEHKDNQKAGEPESCFIHQGEYGIPKVLNIIPYRERWGSDFYRFDSMLDAYEESAYFYTKSGCANRYKILKECIYPYLRYWDVRTGRIVSDKSFYFRRLINSNPKSSNCEIERVAVELGFDNAAECKKYMQPAVPRSLQLLCEFAQVFNDPATIRELRPMIYVYWC